MKTRFASTLLLATALTASIGTAFAQSAGQLNNAVGFQFRPPNDGIPGNTTGGASRNPDFCRIQQSPTQAGNLTLLAPEAFVGHTLAESPELFIRADQTSVKQVFVSFQNLQGETLYQGFQSLTENTGLTRIELPADMTQLELDKAYRLSVVPVCQATLRPDDPVLTGYIRRVSLPQDAIPTETVSSLDMASYYAASGIWYDTLALLQAELSEEPADPSLQSAWEAVLSSGRLP
ncbi:hypothetical protein C7271_11675 [filamentous cyanobacterium CCP5]|nr:hypothetical protein C7271_11675 [filamentous cyanobacterium CCP5]